MLANRLLIGLLDSLCAAFTCLAFLTYVPAANAIAIAQDTPPPSACVVCLAPDFSQCPGGGPFCRYKTGVPCTCCSCQIPQGGENPACIRDLRFKGNECMGC